MNRGVILLLILVIASVASTISVQREYNSYRPEIQIISETCGIQDNRNHSKWCEVPCSGNLIEQAIRCSNGYYDVEVENDG